MSKFNLQYGSKKKNLELGLFLVGCIFYDLASLDSELDSLTSFATKSFSFLLVVVNPFISPHFKLHVGVFRCLLHLGDANKPFD